VTAVGDTPDIGWRFSAAARSYEIASPVQEEVARTVESLVPSDVINPSRVLDVGCGSGRLTALIRARWPVAEITGLDLAEGMLVEARRRFADDPRLHWRLGDAARYEDVPFDLVVSSSALQWLNPLAPALAHLATLVKPGGYFVAGLMTRPTLHELHEVRDAVAPEKRAQRRLPSLDDVRAALAGLSAVRLLSLTERVWTSSYDDVPRFLQALRDAGVTGGDLSRGTAPLSRGELQELITLYARRFADPNGRVRATYGAAFCVLMKA
jgi:malonyl-CoA O-methyltransferase